MSDRFIRSELLIGKEGMARLSAARVIVFGVGGVGGYAVEALARSGVGAIDVVDNDSVSLSNINRQILATTDSVGESKVDVAEKRVLLINPDCKVTKHKMFYLPSNADEIDFSKYDYVLDAIDTVVGKLEIIKRAKEANVAVISCMGAGNKSDPTAFKVADLYKTSACPLAKVMRRECRKMGINGIKVVYSEEEPVRPLAEYVAPKADGARGKDLPGSLAFVPSVAGLIMAGEVIKDLSHFYLTREETAKGRNDE